MESAVENVSITGIVLTATACAFLIIMGQQWLNRFNRYSQYIEDLGIKANPRAIQNEAKRLANERELLEQRYQQGKLRHQQLLGYLKNAESTLAQYDTGLEPPIFSEQDHEAFKSLITKLRDIQSETMLNGEAIKPLNDGEISETYAYLLMRSFNTECEALIRKLSMGNLGVMSAKLRDIHSRLNSNYKHVGLSISEGYLNLKLKELEAWHTAIEQRKNQSHNVNACNEEQAGFIYVLSNIGSFGKDILAIGYTQEANLDDVLKRLSDESTPYPFAHHCSILSSDVKETYDKLTEALQHQSISNYKGPLTYYRITLPRLKAQLDTLGMVAQWYFDTPSRDFIESQLLREGALPHSAQRQASSLLPSQI